MSLAFAVPTDPIPFIGDIALFTDFDGTLVEMVQRPDTITVPPKTIALLTNLREKTGGAFAIISGRQIADLDRMLAPLSLAAAGCHGAEMRLRPDSEIRTVVEP